MKKYSFVINFIAMSLAIGVISSKEVTGKALAMGVMFLLVAIYNIICSIVKK